MTGFRFGQDDPEPGGGAFAVLRHIAEATQRNGGMPTVPVF